MHCNDNATVEPVLDTLSNVDPPLANQKLEAFAQAVSIGEDPVGTCLRLYRCRTGATAKKKAAQLLGSPAITARITTLRREASHIATHQAHFSKADLIAFLVETIQTPVSTVDQHHRQCQEWTRDELTTSGRRPNAVQGQKTQMASSDYSSAGKRTTSSRAKPSTKLAAPSESTQSDATPPPPILLRSKTKLPSKLDAAKLLATLCGWQAPSKVEGNVSLTSPAVEEALSRLLK
ncbi:hypothetical protein DES53_115134 [Roseimicrobium gellanilyticum]|uniref:Uncharacterized protein n=1 Tax=Roseimicrobium gellanilyticum TaxID=748857 RepID=A0A366H4R0_9BACT|nr:hypothetical protein [Roseimicrobium gellanilyticum]RBP36993.1 hypothetical protein DES53_115134 [Roseimicrobium gellanilyticum]